MSNTLYERLLNAKQNNCSISIDSTDVSTLIDLCVNSNEHFNAQADYSMCDIERTCKEKEMRNSSPVVYDCMTEAILCAKSGEKLDQSLRDIGFFVIGEKLE
jgi:hypothetical protein